MSDEITIEIQESPPVNITLDDGCEVQVSIDGSVSSVYWQDVLNKPDFDTLYYPRTNPSGYVTGSVVRPSETGVFYLASNPSGFISGAVVRPDTYILRDSNSLQSINWQTRVLAFEGLYSIGWGDRYLYDGTETPVLDWNSRSLLGVWSSDSDPVGGNDLVRLSYLSGGYYPLSNPSGFATGIDASNLVTKSETGAYTGVFYPRGTNPSGYVTGLVVRPSETGSFINTSQTGNFYPRSNPSGFVLNESTIVRTDSNQAIYGLKSFPSGIVNDVGVLVIEPSAQTLIDSNGVASVGWTSKTMYGDLGIPSLHWADRRLIDVNSYTSIDWNTRTIADATGNSSIDYGGRALVSSDTFSALNWDLRYLINDAGQDVLNWNTRILGGGIWSTPYSPSTAEDLVNFAYLQFYAYPITNPSGYITGSVVRPNQTGALTGAFYPLSANPSGYVTGNVIRPSDTGVFVTSTQTGSLTGAFYPLVSNPSNYVTGTVVRPSDTGVFVTTSQTGTLTGAFYPLLSNPSNYVTGQVIRPSDTGQFYPTSNPSGFITGVNLSAYVLASQTGSYTGIFYPLNSNPSGYVTGSVIRPSDTGNFTTSSQTGSLTGSFYPLLSNPSGYVTGSVIRPSDTGVFVSQSQTGSLTGAFYPLSSNPSSYVTGLVVRPSETGAFATTGWVDENYYPRSNPSGYSAGGGGLTQQQTMAIASLGF